MNDNDFEQLSDAYSNLEYENRQLKQKCENLARQREEDLRRTFARQSREEDEFAILHRDGRFEDGLMDYPKAMTDEMRSVMHRRKTEWQALAIASEEDLEVDGN